MARFKQVPQNFLFRKLLGFWGNMVHNYSDDCHDDDFFDVVRNCFDHDRAVELIELAYTPSELKEMQNAKSRSTRLDLSDSLDDVFNALWNHGDRREKCRAVLDAIREYMLADSKARGEDSVERRFADLKRVLRLDDLESEILVFSYVRDQTCFCWPQRVEDREKPLYYAMALDRSYAEVAKAMSPQGKLLKFNLLDNDYDFSRRTLGGFMDGTSDEAIERRFYTKGDGKDVLPWAFYGDLSSKDGETIKNIIRASDGKCNILLYGAPGTGKTSFARTLAKELGRTAYEIKQGDDDGKRLFFERMFKSKLADAEFDELKGLRNLAPGDFRTVRQEQFYLGGDVSNADRIAALKEECALKKDGNHSARIGF